MKIFVTGTDNIPDNPETFQKLNDAMFSFRTLNDTYLFEVITPGNNYLDTLIHRWSKKECLPTSIISDPIELRRVRTAFVFLFFVDNAGTDSENIKILHKSEFWQTAQWKNMVIWIYDLGRKEFCFPIVVKDDRT